MLANVPDEFDVEILYGHSELAIVSAATATFGKAFTIVLDEKRDLSDQEKHDPQP